MSSPDDNERSDDFPNSDYAPKWTRDSYRQGSPDTAKGEPPPSFLRRSLDPEIVHLPQRARSLDPETVDLTAVMNKNGIDTDFAPRGSLALKPWLANNQGLKLPPALALPTVEALPPYNSQIKALGAQIGAVIPRQGMRDKSGATLMDAKTQVTSVHGHQVLDLALLPLEANFALPLVHEIASEDDRAMLDIAVAAEINLVGDTALAAADASREAGNSPNTVMAAAAAIIGPKRVERVRNP